MTQQYLRPLDLGDLSSTQKTKSPRLGPGASGSHRMDDDDEANMMQMMVHMQKLTIQGQQTQRDMAGCLYTTVIVPIETEWTKKPLAAGARYAEAVRGNPGHGLGAPHIHVAVAMMSALQEEVVKLTLRDQPKWEPFQLMLNELMSHLKGDQGINPQNVNHIFASCRLRQIFPNKKKMKPKQDAQQADRVLVQVGFQAHGSLQTSKLAGIQITAQIRTLMLLLCAEANGEVGQGGPPPGRSERLVHADHQKLSKLLG